VTTFFPFAPTPQGPVTFLPTLDGAQYSAVVTWNIFGARWYLNLATSAGVPVFTLPLIASPAGVVLQSLTWANGTVTAVASNPHKLDLLATVPLTLSGNSPDAYNGDVDAFVVDALTFTYPLSPDPGEATTIGQASYTINLAAGYFQTSTLAFRNGQFEVNP